jgi:hypothetical protein
MSYATMHLDNNIQAFFALVRAGLWERCTQLSEFGNIGLNEVYRLAEEQSVVGLVAAGIEHVEDVKVPQAVALTFVGSTLQLEQQNKAMNVFVAKVIDQLRSKDIYALLVKGQGIAQCYERPLWRASGDVDLLLSDTNYEKAKVYLLPLAVGSEQEYKVFKHLGMTMKEGFVVELHGTLHSRLSKRIDKGIDEAQNDVFLAGSVRSWINGNTQIFLPGVNEDVIFLFTHILHHYYIEGIGLRQICDWCRFLWTYKEKLNVELLEKRLNKMGLMTEWKAFAAVAVDWLGVPVEAMPLYSSDKKWSRKADRIIAYVLKCGNFGNNRRRIQTKSFLGGKMVSLHRKISDFMEHETVFPIDSIKFLFYFIIDGIRVASQK